MLLNETSVSGLTTGYKTSFQAGFTSVQPTYQQVATVPPRSTTRTETYPWLGDLPSIREWIGERQTHKLKVHGYSITNKPFESTVEVDRDDVSDDQYGIYAPLMQQLGAESALFPDQLVFGLLAAAWSTLCYDGQNLIDTDHPGYTSAGAEVSVSNSGGGSGNPWFLIDARKPIKPLIFQEREPFKFGLLQGEDAAHPVPKSKALVYGVNGRCNVGTGLWQLIYGSKDTLDATNFAAAYAAMTALRRANGQPLGVQPSLLVCGGSNRAAARTLLKAQNLAGGGSNINFEEVDLLVTPWLA